MVCDQDRMCVQMGLSLQFDICNRRPCLGPIDAYALGFMQHQACVGLGLCVHSLLDTYLYCWLAGWLRVRHLLLIVAIQSLVWHVRLS